MTKQFKEYDKKFAHVAGTALNSIRNKGGSIAKEDINEITKWDQDVFGKYYVPSQSSVQFAVYEALDHEEWQKFRVSLKGLSTKEKLYCLMWMHGSVECYGSWQDKACFRTRVNNYLGALIRGGQLNTKLEVVR